ncbi:uncharacterized protein LOC131424662 [Marmota monax]|uniref:uncharacterized protein LOC131424662 n=1 Tax=Marmota monax TaxID=9995 RepID=UPI0026F3306B|nr:uncharacterized protein LOC131424662 [Marmota monax]
MKQGLNKLLKEESCVVFSLAGEGSRQLVARTGNYIPRTQDPELSAVRVVHRFNDSRNTSQIIGQYLAGNWSMEAEKLIQTQLTQIAMLNNTRVDPVTLGQFTNWLSSFSFFKEWVEISIFGAMCCFGVVLCLWLFCRLRARHSQEKAMIVQAFAALENGISPQAWLAQLKQQFPGFWPLHPKLSLTLHWDWHALLFLPSQLWKAHALCRPCCHCTQVGFHAGAALYALDPSFSQGLRDGVATSNLIVTDWLPVKSPFFFTVNTMQDARQGTALE